MTISRFTSCTHTRGHGGWLRWIASWLPLKTDYRISIRIPTIASPQRVDAERSDATGEFFEEEPVGLNLVPQLLRESGEDVKYVGKESCVDPIESSVDPETEEEMRAREAVLQAELAKIKRSLARYCLEDMGEPVPEYLKTEGAPPPPPPPPPPLPEHFKPETSTVGDSRSSTKDEIRPLSVEPSSEQPDMACVLQGIGSVKLKPLKGGKSPGGTPLRPINRGSNYDPYDPASIIREAMRRKFSNPVFQEESPGKENTSWSDSSFSVLDSPTAKLLH